MSQPAPTFPRPAQSEEQRVKAQQTAAELQAKYASMAAERRRLDFEERRLNREEAKPLPVAAKTAAQLGREAAMLKRSQILAAKSAEKEFSLPDIENTVGTAMRAAADLPIHRGFKSAVGLPNPLSGGFGLFSVPGTPAGDFEVQLEGSKNEAFGVAIAKLVGMGAMSNMEGAAITKGLQNLKTGMSEDQFKVNTQQYIDKMAAALEVARKMASMGGSQYTYGELMAEKKRRTSLQVKP